MVSNALKSIIRFVRLMRHAPTERTGMEASREAAKRVREASHVSRGHSFMTPTDKLFGKEIAGGHEKARKRTPPPKAR